MSKFLGVLSVPIIAGDAASPANGDVWYNSSTGKFRKRENGSTSDLDTTGAGLSKVNVAGASATLTVDSVTTVNSSTTNCPLTLPTTIPLGSVFEIVGGNAAGWKIVQNANQKIICLDIVTITGTTGYAQSDTTGRECIRLVCTVADLELTVVSSMGQINYNT